MKSRSNKKNLRNKELLKNGKRFNKHCHGTKLKKHNYLKPSLYYKKFLRTYDTIREIYLGS